MKMRAIVWSSLVLLVQAACAGAGEQASVDELLELQDVQRRAHLEKNAELLVALFADDFMNIQNGEITRPGRDESRARFQAYFDASSFLAWEDLTPPIIRVSADRSMAYVVVQKRVRLQAGASSEVQEAEFAWLETYEKRGGEWALTALASTQRTPGRT
jgi:hypothetical protein